jgi:hypothetical protein
LEPTERSFGEENMPPGGEPRGDQHGVTNWGDLADQLQGEIRHQADLRPYVTVLAAATAGYVLGAGIPRWMWRYAFDMGSKLLVARVVAAVVGESEEAP